MKSSLFVFVSLTAFAGVLHADPQRILRASFPDGAGLEITTETTGSTQINSEGEIGIGPGIGSQDLVNRVVVDRANSILFVYNLEAFRGGNPGTVGIRIKPISAATETGMLKDARRPGRPQFSGAHLPTVAGVREFPAVKIGEAVTLDILYDPATGEKIFDVLRPIAATPGGMSVTVVPFREEISLMNISIRVNGRTLSTPASFLIGSAVRIDIPHYGTYVVAAYDPHEVASERRFTAIAQAEGKTVSWTMGRDRVEIASSKNILSRPGKAVLWVYHDSHYQPDEVGLQSADQAEWLLPKR